MKPYITVIALALTFCLSGCLATSGDLHDLANDFASFEEGTMTGSELEEAIEAKADEIEERVVALADSMPTSPGGWAALLAQVGAAAMAGGYGVNRYRNKKREGRGEPV